MMTQPEICTLKSLLPVAEQNRYAVGAYSPRYTAMIQPILRAGQSACSPLIIQISEKELFRHRIAIQQFSDAFYHYIDSEKITVPVVLHLDHTKDMTIIRHAITAGFTSVMIDASDKPLKDNIATSRQVVEYAHAHGVSVEAELGRIATADFVETDTDEELYTDPDEAQRFVTETGIDALAVSVGTAHGVYKVRQPTIDLDRLRQIRERTSLPLVLHGGSGVPAEMMRAAIQLPGGGVSKVNIATDLELAALAALGEKAHLTDAVMSMLPVEQLIEAQAAVEHTVLDKIENFVGCKGKAFEK